MKLLIGNRTSKIEAKKGQTNQYKDSQATLRKKKKVKTTMITYPVFGLVDKYLTCMISS